jgi:hypothetical protein
MTIASPFAAKTANVSTITAAEINAAGVAHESAIDGVGGSAGTPYAPATVIQIGGSGLKLSETTGAASNLQLGSRSVTRFQCTAWTADPSDWGDLQGGGALSASTGTYMYIPLDLPHGATLTAVAVYLDGAAHGGAWPPANMPKARVSRVSSGNTETVIGAESTDASNQVTFEISHPISVTGLSEVIDRTLYRYNVRLQSESGANGIVGAQYVSTSCTYTMSSYTEY